MSNPPADPTAPGPRPEPSPALVAMRRRGWALWGLPGILLYFGAFPLGLWLDGIMDGAAFAVVSLVLWVIALTPFAAAAFDGRLRTALALVVSLAIFVALLISLPEPLGFGGWMGGSMADALARASLFYATGLYTVGVAAVFGVAWLVRWFLRRWRSSAADAPQEA